MSDPARTRLPDRRPQLIEPVIVGNATYDVAIGFDPRLPGCPPREVFLGGARIGADMAVILADVAVVISIALQHGLAASLFTGSVARVPEVVDGPPTRAASVIGAALDLIA